MPSAPIATNKVATSPLPTVIMNQEQIDAAYKLLNLMDADAVAQADTKTYGDWYTHLSDHLMDVLSDLDEDVIIYSSAA